MSAGRKDRHARRRAAAGPRGPHRQRPGTRAGGEGRGRRDPRRAVPHPPARRGRRVFLAQSAGLRPLAERHAAPARADPVRVRHVTRWLSISTGAVLIVIAFAAGLRVSDSREGLIYEIVTLFSGLIGVSLLLYGLVAHSFRGRERHRAPARQPHSP